jgi:uncharacterized membrane protein
MTELYTLPQWILFFYIYCFIGWVWESTYVSICQRRFVNRGFLKGPFLPIYGSGAICILVVTIPVRDSIPLMFFVGMAAATLLEYVTGAVMEKMFRVRYWDYSKKFMNVNGYICLSSTICWGVMTILMVEVIQVHVEPLVMWLGDRYTERVVMVITPAVFADFVTSFIAAIHLRDALIMNDKIKEEMQKLNARKEALEEELEKMRERSSVLTPAHETGESAAENGGRMAGAGEWIQEAGGRLLGAGERTLQAAGEKIQGASEKLLEAGEKLREAGGKLQNTGDRLPEEGEMLQGMENRVLESKDTGSENSGKMAGVGEKLQGASEKLLGAGERIQGISEKAYAQIREELQDIYVRTGEYKEKLRRANTKSTRGLLRRNPTAVSKIHSESFAELKKNLTEKLEEIRR